MNFALIAVLAVALDRATKLLALANLTEATRVAAWPGVLEWQLTRNEGLALGLLSGNALANLVLPILAVVVGWLILRRYRLQTGARIAAAAVLGGFLGNLIDRVASGYVLDMIFFPWMPWFICNVADVCICAGIAYLCASLLFAPGRWRLKTEEDAHEPHHRDGKR